MSHHRESHIHILAACKQDGMQDMAIVSKIEDVEKVLDNFTDVLERRIKNGEEILIHNRGVFSMEFHRFDRKKKKHEYAIIFRYCFLIMNNCRIRMELDRIDAADERGEPVEGTGGSLAVTQGPDGVVAVEFSSHGMEPPPEVKELIDKIVELLIETTLSGFPTMEKLNESDDMDEINRRFRGMMGE